VATIVMIFPQKVTERH